MLLVGFTTYAQSGKSARVATNEQLVEAMQNPSVGTIELQAGFYPYLNYQADDGAKVIKSNQDSGNRTVDCLYYIINGKDCFEPIDDPIDPYFGFDNQPCQAGFQNPGCGDCCPPYPNYPGATWSVTYQEAGSTVFFEDATQENTFVYANKPGLYILRYTWPAPWNSHVETQYFFYGPISVDLQADNVCEADGLSTTVNFTLTSAFDDPLTVVSWTLNGAPFTGPDESGSFPLTVTECGPYVLAVVVEPSQCPPVYEEIEILFDF
jgi:hypothetical protein